MSALENVLVGEVFGRGGAGESPATARERAEEMLALMGLKLRAHIAAAELTLVERKLLQVARALATRPRVLLLDEPLAGLTPAESEHLVGVIRQMGDRGKITFLWIEHRMRALRAGCDRLLVLYHGRKLAEGTPEQVMGNAEVVKAYLGRRAGGPS